MAVNLKQQKGISLIEALLAVALITTAFVSFLTLSSLNTKVNFQKANITRAKFLAQEAVEAIRNFRDSTEWEKNGLGTLQSSISYHLEKTGSPLNWILVPGEKQIGKFTQKIVFENVYRDSNDNITLEGGTLDPDTKKVIITISWQEKAKEKKVEITTYLTNWQK